MVPPVMVAQHRPDAQRRLERRQTPRGVPRVAAAGLGNDMADIVAQQDRDVGPQGVHRLHQPLQPRGRHPGLAHVQIADGGDAQGRPVAPQRRPAAMARHPHHRAAAQAPARGKRAQACGRRRQPAIGRRRLVRRAEKAGAAGPLVFPRGRDPRAVEPGAPVRSTPMSSRMSATESPTAGVGASDGRFEARVPSSDLRVPLADARVEELRAALAEKAGGTIKLETKVDPGLIGGLIVQLGSQMIDTSIRTRLEGVRRAMKEAA